MYKREELINLLGIQDQVAVSGKTIFKEDKGDYILEHVILKLNTIETVPGILAYPKDNADNLPLVVFNHSHGGDFTKGKKELFNSSHYLQNPSFGETLLNMGYAVAAIDHFCFEERGGKKESEVVKEFLVKGRTLWGMRLFDSMNFITYLSERKEIDSSRIATIGMSMGGLMSWWLGSLDERVKVIVDIAGQVDLETLMEERGLDHHGFYYYVPKLLLNHTTFDIQGLIAPRARLSITGKDDNMCPVRGVLKLKEQLYKQYREYNCSDRISCQVVTGGHQETTESRVLWMDFLKNNL